MKKLLLAFFFWCSTPALAATYYVATTGSDSNPGSQVSPWLTVQKAANTAVAGDTVNIGAGTYYERVVFPNSGSSGLPITFQGTKTGAVFDTIIEGSDVISGTWSSYGSGIWKIAVAYEPWSVTEGDLYIQRVSKTYMDGASIPSSAGVNGLTYMSYATGFVINWGHLNGTNTQFWDGLEALFGYTGGFLYVRYRDGSDPTSKNLRMAPGPTSLSSFPPANTAAIGISGKSFLTIKDLEIRGAHVGVLIRSSGATQSNSNIIEDNRILGGHYRVYLLGTVGSNIIRNNTLLQNAVGQYVPYQASAIAASGAGPTRVSFNLYMVNKFAVGETTENDAGIKIWSGGVSGPSNNEIDGNTIAEGGQGLRFDGGDSGTLAHDNTIRNMHSQAVYLSSSISNLRIYDNLFHEYQNGLRYNDIQYSGGPIYIHGNKFWTYPGYGYSLFFNAISSPRNGSSVVFWIYHNSISGGSLAISCCNFDYSTYPTASWANLRIVDNLFHSSPTTFEMQQGFNTYGNPKYDYNLDRGGGAFYFGSPSWRGSNNAVSTSEWIDTSLPDFVPAPSSLARNAGLDISATFTLQTTQFSALPGFSPGYFSAAQPDLGAFQTGMGADPPAVYPSVIVSTEGIALEVSESGTQDTFTVVLGAQPATDVVLTVVSSDTGEATVSPATLTFTNANYATPQTVTVTGVPDALVDGTQIATITVAVDDANSDDAYDPLADKLVLVNVLDVTSGGGGFYGNNYTWRSVVDIDDTLNTGTHTNFPAYFRFTGNNFKTIALGGKFAQSGCQDLRWETTAGVKLDHTLAQNGCDTTAGVVAGYVELPSLTDALQVHLFIGNAAASGEDTGTATFNANILAMWQLGDGDSTAAGFYQDATASNKDLTLTDADADSIQAAGKVGNAMDLNGDADFLATAANVLDPSVQDWTFCAWVKGDALGSGEVVGAQADGTGTGATWVNVDTSGTVKMQSLLGASSLFGTSTLSTGTFYFLCESFDIP